MQWSKSKKSRGKEPIPADRLSGLPARLQQLARKLDRLPELDRKRIAAAAELESNQRSAAEDLYKLCRSFVDTMNAALNEMRLEMSPDVFDADALDSSSGVLMQINASGRIVQLKLAGREPCASTEHFRLRYILEGRMQWFNQDLLDKHNILENHMFYVLDTNERGWRYYDPRSRRSGEFDHDYLADALEQLL